MNKYVWFGGILFYIGLVGLVLTRRNVLIALMCIELMLLGIVEMLAVFSVVFWDVNGEIFSLFILTVAAAETATGLALLVNYYKNNKFIGFAEINRLKG
jgi:NADH-quinone oxidoreductase subunit K